MKYKIIKSEYDRATGISETIIQSPKGIYTGHSYLQDEDRKYESNYVGCRYAEIKAIIKMIKAEIKENQIKLNAIKSVYSKGDKKALSKMKELSNIINELEDLKYDFHSRLMEDIEDRPKVLEAFYKKIRDKNK